MTSAMSTERHAFVADAVPAGARRRPFDHQPEEPGRVQAVHAGPAVGPVAHEARKALLPCDADQDRDEAVVAHPVHRRRQPDGRRADPLLGQGDGGVLRRHAGHDGGVGHIVLGPEGSGRQADVAEREQQRPRRDDERLAGARQRLPDRLNGLQVDRGPDRHVGEVVHVAQVDDAVGLRRRRGAGCRDPRGRPAAPRRRRRPERRRRHRNGRGPRPRGRHRAVRERRRSR